MSALLGRILCKFGWHDWVMQASVTIDHFMVFGSHVDTFDFKQCSRCRCWNTYPPGLGVEIDANGDIVRPNK